MVTGRRTAVVHESSLMTSLMRRIEEVASAEGARRVVGVSVWLGALSHMSARHFAEHFERAAAGTIAEGARLDVNVSEDTYHAHAQDLLIESVEVEV
jgi:hydrogenase nickel incorporation protein HypA/HybF